MVAELKFKVIKDYNTLLDSLEHGHLLPYEWILETISYINDDEKFNKFIFYW